MLSPHSVSHKYVAILLIYSYYKNNPFMQTHPDAVVIKPLAPLHIHIREPGDDSTITPFLYIALQLFALRHYGVSPSVNRY